MGNKKKGKDQRRAAARTAEEDKNKEQEELQKTLASMKAELKALRKENEELKGKVKEPPHGAAQDTPSAQSGKGKGNATASSSREEKPPPTPLDEKWVVKTAKKKVSNQRRAGVPALPWDPSALP